MKIKVGIVAGYASKHPAGLERTLIIYLRALNKYASPDIDYLVYTNKTSNLNKILKEEGIDNIGVIEVGWSRMWKHIGLFFAPKADAYIFNGPIVSLLFKPRNYLLLLYDFAYKYFGDGSRMNKKGIWLTDFFTKLGLKRAKRVITLSDATKEETIKFFDYNKNNITTAYPGFFEICNRPEEKVDLGTDKYILFVGTVKERKNARRVIQSFVKFRQESNFFYKLIIVGKCRQDSPYVKEILQIIKRAGLEKEVVFSGHITDNQLCYLYKHAAVVLFPSLLEGFGFPVIEAMSCGVPVITSNISSLKEISGDAAVLVDPVKVDDISRAIKQVVSDEELRRHLIARGCEQIKYFTARRAAESIDEAVREAVKKNN